MKIMKDEEEVMKIELKVKMIEKGKGERLMFRGEVKKKGRKIMVRDGKEFEVKDKEVRIIDKMKGKMMVVKERKGLKG